MREESVRLGLLGKVPLGTANRDFRNYGIALIVFASIALCLYLDADATLTFQNFLGVCAWVFLFALLRGESGLVRAQVLVAVAFATIGEHFASPYMEGYIYRFHNVPAYVPPGHGMVYLTAVALARSELFKQNLKVITATVLTAGGLWSLWGVTIAPQGDMVGALLFIVFVLFVLFGRSPGVYLGAFFVTTWLELIGVSCGTWRWVPIDPVLQLPQGNPPSGVAAWYCLVDAVALGVAPAVVRGFQRVHTAFWQQYFYPQVVPRLLFAPYLQQDYIPVLVPAIWP
ncbi:hypothetical protein [Nitrosococcus oceani]|uniref:Uncharacterized protein n=2 Tax=Nitrosococcus oceani TaxID=1229 RepID=Q3JEV8_NITOC|nr:hypothetical protein [Nitrosococcus oceani]KFI20883.1 hypothetical protein IB75_00460 [Nitrosococcus oceani C-27]ABA56638.1 hypothetical protein Noc_0105 [Nitrosococcus oceani ATCC 19707]EDZ66576.1 hypothetical protein NOC27_3256 [Nitrosococcus oceani AFC27]KFI24022.1 hypothetical protein HW44_00450 [Nitrosococcus oceani]GEM20792.1 hypothetical protein NONS58_22150 [Nitrosococcus oceani]